MRLPFRKPMVVVAPKKLLKFKGASSPIEEFTENTRFLPLVDDGNKDLVAPEQVKRVILCSGQVYYDLEAERKKIGRNDVAILRVESLCPFPFKEIIRNLKSYSNADVTWAQEEPKNAGGYLYAEPRIRNILEFLGKDGDSNYAGRPIMAAAAVGYTSVHNEQLRNLLNDALN